MSPHGTRLAVGMVWLLLLAQDSLGADSNLPAYRRWAIVATKPMEETGLPDLLAAKLAGQQGLELVERQKLPAITEELELSACLGSEAAAKRLKLGQLLGADALVLLSLEEWHGLPVQDKAAKPPGGVETKKFVKLVLSECRYGARLRLEYLPFTGDRLEPLGDDCVRGVGETRRHFAGGVRQVIGVTHFLSKNLTHDHDHLQAGYAYLLEAALMDCPGVAVVETEEARAIRRELDLTAEGLKDRVLPVFVEGEYEMSAAKPGAEPTVRLSIRVTDGKQVRTEIRKEGLAMAEAPELLRGPIARQIARLAQEVGETGLSRKQQHAILTSRADAFSQFGAFEHSTGLREAALLLEPGDVDLRVALIGDYLRLPQVRELAARVLSEQTGKKSDRQNRDAILADFRRTADQATLTERPILAGHTEQVIRSRTLNAREADMLVRRVLDHMRLTPAEQKGFDREVFWRLYPLFPALDCNIRGGGISVALAESLQRSNILRRPSGPLFQYFDWTHSACSCITSRPLAHRGAAGGGNMPGDSYMLHDLFRFLTEVASPAVPLPVMSAVLTRSDTPEGLNWHVAVFGLKSADMRKFYERLTQTGKPLHRFYGRLGLLSLRTYILTGVKLGPDAIREVDSLSKFVQDQDTGDPDYSFVVTIYRGELERLRNEIARRVGGVPQEKRHRLPENPIAETQAAWQVVFEPIEGPKPDWVGLKKCTDSLDLAWSSYAVYAIPAKGTAKRIFPPERKKKGAEPTIFLDSLAWDGNNFWILCLGYGLHVVSPDGEVLGRLSAEEGFPSYTRQLPPFDDSDWPGVRRMVILRPIAPGKCLAIGKLGPEGRLWFALITHRAQAAGPEAFEVKIFHTAAKSPPADRSAPDDDPNEIFSVGRLSEYAGPRANGKRMLLVGRGSRHREAAALNMGPSAGARASRWPLAIDLESLAVSVLHTPMPCSLSPYFIEGHVVEPFGQGIGLHSPPQKEADPWTYKAILEVPIRQWERLAGFQARLLLHEGMAYQPGAARWNRVDPLTWEVQPVKSTAVPYQIPFQFYAVSAHYGMVGWSEGCRLCRISVIPCPTSAEDLKALYPYVPAAAQAAHHRAAQAIRGLGGSVDTRWGFCPHGSDFPGNAGSPFPWPKPESEPRTIVYLSDTWNGGDAGLKHLEELYNLRVLYLVRAPVGDGGLRTVGRIRSLDYLYLVETKATDAGLAHLKGLDQLVYLRLEGTTGGRQFTNAGLTHLRGLPELEKLTLYGDGFTDDAWPALEGLPGLGALYLFNTGITKATLDQHRPWRTLPRHPVYSPPANPGWFQDPVSQWFD